MTNGQTKTFYNESEDEEPLKPILQFTVSETYAIVEIEVYNDDLSYDETTILYSVAGKSVTTWVQKDGEKIDFTVPDSARAWVVGETLSLDNNTGLFSSVDSSGNKLTDLRRVQAFNKKFIKIPQGKVYIRSAFSGAYDVKLKYQNVKRIGGGFY